MSHPNTKKTGTRAIYIVGPSATGKTTLCNALALRLGLLSPAFITETARKVMRNLGYSRLDVGRVEMQKEILEAQLRAESDAQEVVSKNEYRLFLSDRSAVDPVVYALISASRGKEDARLLMQLPHAMEAFTRYQESLFVLLTPVPEWLVDDGIRSLDDQWTSLDGFRDVLKRLEIPFRVIDGASCRTLEERVTLVMGMAGL